MDWFNLDELLRKAPLPEVAMRLGLELKPQGATYLSLCPFHADTHPSLRLFPSDGASQPHFHCFTCNAHGSAIDLVKEAQGTDFEAAVRWLASTFGVQPERHGRTGTGRAPVRDKGAEARAFVEKVYAAAHEVAAFSDWANGRGYSPEFLSKLGLRMVSGNLLVQALQGLPLDKQLPLTDELEAMGLVVRLRQPRKDDGTSYFLPLEEQFRDFFFDRRVVIPIRTQESRVEGYAGRSVNKGPDEGTPKYLLTRGLQKSKHLFNADHAFAALRGEAKTSDTEHTLYIVEGFFDAIRLRSLGLPAVALMGTSLSGEQLDALEKVANEAMPNDHVLTIRLFLDHDSAGLRASARAVRQLLRLHGVALQWVGCSDEDAHRAGLHSGKDPDERLKVPALTPDAARKSLDNLATSAIAALVLEELGSQDTGDLDDAQWQKLNLYHRERVLFNIIRSLRRLSSSVSSWSDRLGAAGTTQPAWLIGLIAALSNAEAKRGGDHTSLSDSLFLTNQVARRNHARLLAYHGSRRGELPCDEPNWLYLDVGASVFDQLLSECLQSSSRHLQPAAPFEAIHLPRKFSTAPKDLADPRRKAMPHPSDLVLQQVLMNELLTERHDFVHGNGETFSDLIPAVRYYRAERRIRVTGSGWSTQEQATDIAEPTLSFAYQVDMEVLEGLRTPSDQGMFRPFGECWRDFMESIGRQTHRIGGQVHVLRLDAKRYYDNICQYVVRDQLLEPIRSARDLVGSEFLTELLGPEGREHLENRLVDRICQCLFEHSYRDPDTGEVKTSKRNIGIPQGPVLSAWIGTIAMFPVDAAAHDLMQRHVRRDSGERSAPRIGYARYVDDIVLLADSEELLSTLRQVVQEAASKLELTLIGKGDTIAPMSPDEIIQHLNEGRNFAASTPTWEPPLTGDGEWGWALGDDGPKLSRQSALRLLRHPGVLDQPDKVHETVREAMLAPDLRPNDLGKCTRLLWWQLAMTVADSDSWDEKGVWERYWKVWSQVTEGHAWEADFRRVGYSVLAAMEGLDRLFDMDQWLEQGRTRLQVQKQQLNMERLAQLVCSTDFFPPVNAERNRSHLMRRQDLITWKARRHINPKAVFEDRQIESTRDRITLEQWFCFATARFMAPPEPITSGMPFDPESALRPLVNRDLVESQDRTRISAKVRDLLLKPLDKARSLPPAQELSDTDEGETHSKRKSAEDLARGLIIAATPREQLWDRLGLYPFLLDSNEPNLQVLPPLPGIANGHLLAVLPNESERSITLRAFWVKEGEQADQCPPSKFWGSDQSASVANNPLSQKWDLPTGLSGGLQRWKASTPLPLTLISNPVALYAEVGRTRFASTLFRALYAIQRQVALERADDEVVPVVPHLATRGEGIKRQWFVLGRPIPSSTLGATGWVRSSGSSLRSVSVPKGYGHLWRIGLAVSDALGLAHDIGTENSPADGDDQLPGHDGVEEYVLRQQLRKLRGQWLSEASVWTNGVDGLPRSLERALEILEHFPSGAPLAKQIPVLLTTEAETRAMAMRLADRSQDGLRDRLHQLPIAVLSRIPLKVLETLPLGAPHGAADMRTDLTAMLAIAQCLRDHLGERDQSPDHVDARSALTSALPLAIVATGLRGLTASLQGLIREPMPEHYSLPPGWLEPDTSRGDPQESYAQIRDWIQKDAWPQLALATPWQWMQAVLGLLHKHLIRNDFDTAVKRLESVYRRLLVWETARPCDAENTEGWAWPFEDLPKLTSNLLTALNALLDEVPQSIAAVEAAFGLVVQQEQAPIYGRNRHDDGFRDARGRHWLLRKSQYTELGQMREGIASVERHQERLVTWTEVRNRRGDDELLSVHVVDNKLARWLGMSHSTSRASDNVEPPTKVTEIKQSVLTDTASTLGSDDHMPPTPSTTATSAGGRQDAGIENVHLNRFRKSGCIRVALFQWRVDESYSHPLIEVGLNGLGLKPWHKDELRKSLPPNSELAVAADACRRGCEHLWESRAEQVLSWPEHRRRRLLTEVLEQCKRLKVDLLVLPEYSVRRETVEWLRKTLKHAPGLAVLAGTYRQLDPRDKDHHFTSLLTLLWQPPREVAKDLLGTERPPALRWERGKKYRAVAVNELFRPRWDNLAPLFRPSTLLETLGFKDKDVGKKHAEALVKLLSEQLPPMQYCMELICSELFMLSSPANIRPLQREIAELLQKFPTGPQQVGDDIVLNDVLSLAELLDIGHAHQHTRRSVLLVPAATSRTNDYWYAGQASVLASATATVFCNAVLGELFKGGSCFIGADSTSFAKEFPGMIDRLTPYHGWSKGIHLGRDGDALSSKDQALVVADLDPVHVVGGKPRPQLLPHPMRLVAYLPVVELLDAKANAHAVMAELSRTHRMPSDTSEEPLRSIQSNMKPKPREPDDFRKYLSKLEEAVKTGNRILEEDLESFANFFSDPNAVRDRLICWQHDRAQQPHAGQLHRKFPPALVDFIKVDLTLKEGQELCSIWVPPWGPETPLDREGTDNDARDAN
ncbi:CHC2 zinc finger domain-containing protein [Ferrovum sp.]|jgi:DNA primase catalytic core|uniref:CHC2 zinc finger domain-containing protein n=1 Tax=Ferrovum sp. TaxID=2609467 RepID=UPI0026212D14|nr:CHC2 zinc finger domain-containing protein [Ferrovum sp.]